MVQWMVVTDGHGKYVSGKVLHDRVSGNHLIYSQITKRLINVQINVLNILTIQNFRSSSSLEMSPSVFPTNNLQQTMTIIYHKSPLFITEQ